jgi:tetratricopeptide (TPR) repeat protein/predicted Ser/Thr protein kinase
MTHGLTPGRETPPTGRRATPASRVPEEVARAQADPAKTVGRYVLTERIGSGGMGEVWKAWDAELSRWIALKFLKGQDADEVERFRREAQVAANLRHPNICAIYEVGSAGGRHYIAMEYVRGLTLGRLPRGDRRRLVERVREAALALQHAHDQGVVHRDVKPANVMVAAESGRAYVMDFGLARQLEAGSSLTASGMMVGTPAYMSPEQARGEVTSIDARSDVWSLGATLYELLGDQMPFNAPNVVDIAMSVVLDEPTRLRKVNPAVDVDLETIVMKCLEKERERRYPTARALADDLGRWLAGDPITARPVSTLRRMATKVKRHRALSAAMVALAVVGVAATAALVMQGRSGAAALDAQRAASARREEALRRLSTQWATIVERKRELRTLASPVKTARRELEEAVRAVDDHVRDWPEEPQGYYVRARGRWVLGDLEGATADIKTALAKRADFRPGWSLLGMIELEEFLQQTYGRPEARPERVKALGGRLDRALESFAKGWLPGREREEAERWALPRTREDEVMERLARAHRLYYVENREAEAKELLLKGLEAYRSEEYLRLAGVWAGDSQEALNLFDALAERAPGYDLLFLDRGAVRQSRGDLEGAVADYERAIALCPDFAMAWNNLGTVRHEQGDAHAAIAAFTRAIECRRGFAMGFYNRGSAKLELGDRDGAIEDFDRAIAVGDGWLEPYINRGNAWREKGHLERAEADFEEVIRRGGRFSEVYVSRGTVKLDRGDRAGAVRDFDEAIACNGRSAVAFAYRGFTRLELGDAGGMADLDKGCEAGPREVRAFFRRGLARRARGNPADAVEDFSRCIELRPRQADAFAQRGIAKRALGDGAGALADYDSALLHDPAHVQARYNRGILRRLTGDAKGAIEDLDRVAATGFTDAQLHTQRGMAQRMVGDFRAAVKDFTEAIRLKPTAEGFYNRAVLYQAQDEDAEARADYDRALELNAEFVEAYANRGRLRQVQGDAAGAAADFGRALELASPSWPSRAKVERWLEETKKP